MLDFDRVLAKLFATDYTGALLRARRGNIRYNVYVPIRARGFDTAGFLKNQSSCPWHYRRWTLVCSYRTLPLKFSQNVREGTKNTKIHSCSLSISKTKRTLADEFLEKKRSPWYIILCRYGKRRF